MKLTGTEDLLHQALQHYWGFSVFRPLQEDIINSVLLCKDTVALLPTGGGKSLCYQLPALLRSGTCLVVSPLLALIKDQVSTLRIKGIEAEYLSSEMDEKEMEIVLSNCRNGLTKILYIAPERLQNSFFISNISDVEISFLAVDEAHCISEWGNDFRPSYNNISGFRSIYPHIPCLALTATATPEVIKEISKKLNFKKFDVYKSSYRRENISLAIENIADKYTRISALLRSANSSGLIYTRTRKEAEDLSRFLQSEGVKNVDYYHAGLPAAEKNRRQNKWLQGHQEILVATNAFGMGIDKDNVRFVIHLSPPASVENYYQEIGRAGRDGAESTALLFYNPTELSGMDALFRSQIPNKIEFQKIVSCIYSVFGVADHDLPVQTYNLDINKIQRITQLQIGKIRGVLAFLHNQGVIFYRENKGLSSLELKITPDSIDQLPRKDAYFLEMLLRHISGLATHRTVFSEVRLSKSLGTDVQLIRARIRDLVTTRILEYVDGAAAAIRFLLPRNSADIAGKYFKIFEQINRNKLGKWEQMKFLVRDNDHCKMRLILSYFGETDLRDCGRCSVCVRKAQPTLGSNLSAILLDLLARQPMGLEDFASYLPLVDREDILENLIILLDLGRVKMLNYKTYQLS